MPQIDAARGTASRVSAAALRSALAVAVVVAAAILLLLRVPDAVRGFDGAAAFGAAHGELDGVVAGANALAIDNGFVAAALAQLPPNAPYGVLLPASPELAQKTYGILPVTLQAIPGFLFETLLPRLPVQDPGKGDYVLCYACDTSPWDRRTTWVWNDGKGHVIGLVRR